MSFLETPQFPSDIAYGFEGGPGYSTRIVVVPGGAEKRASWWSHARARWEATHRGKTQTQTDTLIAFFRVMKGRAHGFRFKDHADFDASGAEGVVSLITGSPQNLYQMYKRYTQGALTEDRLIQKPVSGTVAVSGGGTYTVDYTTGIITHTAGGAPTGWTGEFDVPVRFDTDALRIEVIERTSDGFLYTWGDIPIVEIRID